MISKYDILILQRYFLYDDGEMVKIFSKTQKYFL